MTLGTVTFKYAVRSLTRHTRRTVISMIGIGVGCAMALLALSWMSGSIEMQIRAIAESGSGHLVLVHRQWPDTRENTLRLADWETLHARVNSVEGVESATARARANVLLAFGTRTAGAQLTGVLPEAEYEVNRMLRRGALTGRYLHEEDEGAVVIGKTLATRLNVEIEDPLYATISGRDDIHSAMLTIVGILDTGSQDLDLTICHIALSDLQRITGMEGAGEISVLLQDQGALESMKARLAEAVNDHTAVITWRDIHPGIAAGMNSDIALTRLLSGIVILVVSLGIASAQLTAVLERQPEFGMLSALGMKGGQITRIVLIESLIIGLGGAVAALMLGGASAWYLATHGINIRYFIGDDLGFSDILLDPVLYGSFGPWLITYAASISITATVLASLYPAWKAAHITPADALRT